MNFSTGNWNAQSKFFYQLRQWVRQQLALSDITAENRERFAKWLAEYERKEYLA